MGVKSKMKLLLTHLYMMDMIIYGKFQGWIETSFCKQIFVDVYK